MQHKYLLLYILLLKLVGVRYGHINTENKVLNLIIIIIVQFIFYWGKRELIARRMVSFKVNPDTAQETKLTTVSDEAAIIIKYKSDEIFDC